ncbi:uncharacterized protein LOC103315466 isoform X2 [Nasonia vitripennis]|uniref:Uncharacterized protein n=1 Tax=Nasonia vitripennis TaxID=7425 RepID=A0A7M7H7G5_NASVI|nr:uncharacterized protein LOC103315466 isoform X2 [Nasonia vitripennis]
MIMLLSRLGLVTSKLCKINRTSLLLLQRYMSKKSVDLEKPIEYSSSSAAQWKAEYTRSPPSEMRRK